VCSIVVAWQCLPGVPLVLAANRDERLGRPTDAPLQLADDPAIWGGRDRVAGGTWLAVDPAAGRVCALTNRHSPDGPVAPDPSKLSRGALPVLLLAARDGARRALAGLDPAAYNPVNLLWFDPASAWWSTLSAGGDLAPGVHVLTVRDVDDLAEPKTQRLLAAAKLAAGSATGPTDLRDRLAALLTSHETDPDGAPHSAACIHGDEYGTVSSSTVVLTNTEQGPDDKLSIELRYAPGRPCVTPYELVPLGT
jgi:uncharacterized protein with NRDE domain